MQRCARRRTASGSVIVAVMMVVVVVVVFLPPLPSSSSPSSPSSDSSSSLSSSSSVKSLQDSLQATVPPPAPLPPSLKEISEESCRPRHDLVFLKTHKCASSTTQRIFLRYGKQHGLTQALPSTGNYLGSPRPFKEWMLPRSLRTPDGKYNMMVVHTRLDAESVAKVLRKDASWITIVREPVAQFESLWGYFEMEKFYNMPLEEFADLPYEKVVRWRLAKVYGIHQMFYDLGYGSAEDLTPTDMDRILTKLNSTFDLVMVAERYDESLVLLKDLMCWTADDVAYLSINFRKRKPATNKIAPETREKLLQLSYPDAKIYEYFLKVFEKKVEAFGRVRMAKELAAVQDANKRLAEKCVVNEDSPLRAEKGMEWVGVVGRVTVRRDVQDCVDVVRTEHDMLNDVRDRQRLWVERGWRGNLSQVVVSPR